jgi:SAM-dependent methyltransferase
VGRLSRSLAEHFDEVCGVDISPRMIELAEANNPFGNRCRYLVNDRPDLRIFPAESFDLVYTSLVLQHLRPAYARGYLTEFGRVLRPGGALVCHIPVRPRRSVKGAIFRLAPARLVALGQRLVLRYPAPMEMHGMPAVTVTELLARAGMDVVDAVPEDSYGGHWHYLRYFAVKR